MEVNKERLALGLAALRSGDYIQGTGALKQLHDGVIKHCCLGVLTDVAIANGCDTMRTHPGKPAEYQTLIPYGTPKCGLVSCRTCKKTDGPSWTYDTPGNLHPMIQEFYGLPSHDPVIGSREVREVNDDGSTWVARVTDVEATVANDELGWDFLQIAQAFEDIYMGDGDVQPG